MALPREDCPYCGRSVPVRVNGDLREHRVSSEGPKCPASGASVVEAESMVSTDGDDRLERLGPDGERPEP